MVSTWSYIPNCSEEIKDHNFKESYKCVGTQMSKDVRGGGWDWPVTVKVYLFITTNSMNFSTIVLTYLFTLMKVADIHIVAYCWKEVLSYWIDIISICPVQVKGHSECIYCWYLTCKDRQVSCITYLSELEELRTAICLYFSSQVVINMMQNATFWDMF